ncbi:hypothetical protein MNBD_GAMMA07-2727 [hydrothermal vent metagenome]|uniref:Polymerase beta nucleotidyltransferase domain-containing protein n=1 Tax=hydrothermal vent metagenome TaxID=652676 RepID=A0A3B0WFJ7_9ZZZZ
MRLTKSEIASIKHIVLAIDENAKIYLYGSRVDDTKRGGDIDLLVISEKMNFSHKLDISGKLFEALDEQKVDLLIEKDFNKPFTAHIKETAITL